MIENFLPFFRRPRPKPLTIGTRTQWGIIQAAGVTDGERYYWMVDKRRVVSMMPADVVEASHERSQQNRK